MAAAAAVTVEKPTTRTGIRVLQFFSGLAGLLGLACFITGIALFASDSFKKNEKLDKNTKTLLPTGLLVGGIVLMIIGIVAGVKLTKYER